MARIEILESTLRDGAQGEGVSYSVQDKIHICQALDRLGIDFIEAGNPGSNPKDYEFFQEIQKINFQNSKICAFGATRRKEISCEHDSNIQSLLAAATDYVVIFGKSWTFQVTDIIKTSLEEIASMMGTKVFKTTIRESTNAQKAQATRTSLIEYAPDCTTAEDYKNFVEEFLKGAK